MNSLTKLGKILTAYLLQRGEGMVFSEHAVHAASRPGADPRLAFVSQAKLTPMPCENRAIAIAPSLGIDVISGSESQLETERRLRDYLAANVEV